MNRLQRFLSPQIAKLILSAGDDRVLESHRRAITVVFCDLRGFTAFSELTEPEEVMSSIRLGLTLDARGRPQGRLTGDPEHRDSKLRLMARR